MTSPKRIPIFDGHNDVLLRLHLRGGVDAASGIPAWRGEGPSGSPESTARRICRRPVRDLCALAQRRSRNAKLGCAVIGRRRR